MKTILTTTALCLFATASAAQDSSFQLDASLGGWFNNNGGAGMFDNGGISTQEQRIQGDISLSYARDFGPLTGVAAVHYAYFTPASSNANQDDATSRILDITLRGIVDNGPITYGGFAGYGQQDDYGDSDELMDFAYAGAEFSRDVDWGSYFGQIGYMTGEDEYNESTKNAPFLNVGANYGLANGMELYGALAYAGGIKYGEERNRIIDLRIGATRDFGNLTGYIEAQSLQISYDDGTRYGDTFNSLSVGITMEFGGDANHGTALPDFGRWSAFNANEIE